MHSRAVQKTSDLIWQDAQHQVLFRLLDQVAEEDSAQTVVQELRFYAESHFALEELYMEQLAYPGRDEHVQAHNKFRQELEQMVVDDEESHDAVSRQLISTFLREWLKRHIFGIDKKLEAFILAADAK
jgi:hemerythrin